ncbi:MULTISPECIES: hypothetical protein [unclassified Streptomyces]|uniref:hypothetical protein n=1 Tax=unclassified Streptomyces TaxID=2593676 RepID=UPI001BE7FE76|nr:MULTISPECIES: hypothetical protein [unclassified Streptomyces]MBT2408757.1 hypothetical protein [Streptomyces sp. ISL-21]MBT2613831.1 hypothetical protein [Streptomyces sp. ISL-87]
MTERAARLTRFSFVAAPVLLIAYGSVRLLVEGSKEPGAAWTTGHLAFLLGVLFFGVACEGLRRMAAASGGPVRRRVARAGMVAGLVGAAAAATQAVIDLYAGLQAADKPEMREIFAQVQDVPGVMPAVYTVGPAFLYLGMITLLAALKGRDAVRSLALFVLGTATIVTNLDLMPLGGLCYLLAFAPLRRRTTDLRVPPAATVPSGRTA